MADATPALITASKLGVDGEHGPLFADVDLEIGEGLHAIQMPGGWGQTALLLTLSGRLKPSHGSVAVCGAERPQDIRKHCAIAAFPDIDDLEDAVTVATVVDEQRRWLTPWRRRLRRRASDDAGADTMADTMATVFGDLEPPSGTTFVSELSDLDSFLLRVTLAMASKRPILVVGDLEQVRDNDRRDLAVERLGALAEHHTVVVGVTNPLGSGAPLHDLHDHRILTGKDA